MADFVESAKNFVSAAVSRTSWEAQKQLRVRSKQSEIDKLQKQREQLLDELGRIAIQLYQSNALSNQQLSRLCASVIELDADMQTRNAQLKDLKSEAYPADQFAPAPTGDYTPPVSNQTPSRNATQSPGTTTPNTPNTCPTCGSALRPNALYCRSCGTKLR